MTDCNNHPCLKPFIGARKIFKGFSLFVFCLLLSLKSFSQGPTISYNSLLDTCKNATDPSGQRTLIARISDPDGVPTSGIGLPVLYWRYNLGNWNSIRPDSSWSSNYRFRFGNFNYSSNTITSTVEYFIVAQDNTASVNNVTISPAQQTALSFLVDPPSLQSIPVNFNTNSYAVRPILSGNYSVGVGQAVGRGFETLTDAFSTYNNSCLNGPVNFILTDTLYSSNEQFPIIISNNQASSFNTLTIKPNTSLSSRIYGKSDLAIFKFNGADFLIFDGSNNATNTRNLTIKNDSSSSSSCVFLLSSLNNNGCTGNVIKNCNISGNATSTTFAGIGMSGTLLNAFAESANTNNVFINNLITTAYQGIYINGNITGESGNVISGNTIGSATTAAKIGYRSIAVFNQVNSSINGNTLSGVSSGFVSNNEVDASGGIILGGNSTNVNISSNTISDIANIAPIGSPSYGICLQGNASASVVRVFNNFIYGVVGKGNSISAYANGMAITVLSGGGYGIYFNSVNLATNQNNSNTGISSCLYIGESVSGTLDVRDNIFANRQTTGSRYAIYNKGPASVFNTSINFNDYFSSGILGFQDVDRPNLLSWQSVTNADGGSVTADPQFVSNTNLNLLQSSPLNNQGQPISGIITDFYNTTRSATTPDIGAFEFTPPSCTGNNGGLASVVTSSLYVCVSGNVVISCSGFSFGNGISYQWQFSTDSTNWNDLPGETNPANANPPIISASTFYRLKVVCAAGSPGYSNVVKINVSNPQIINTVGASRCGNGSLVLSATGNAQTTINWYTTSNGGAPVGTGSSFTTPFLNTTTVYYAEPSFVGNSGSCGPASPSAVSDSISTQLTPWNVYFNILNATTLASVDIFPIRAGDAFSVEVYDSVNVLKGSVPFITNVSGGATPQTIPLNFFLRPGYGYYMKIKENDIGNYGTGGFSRNKTGANYPYNSSDIVITGNEFNPNYYMCLYNWKFINGCTVSRAPVTASIGIPANFTLNGTTSICRGDSTVLTATSSNPSYSYSWNPTPMRILSGSGSSVYVSPIRDTTYTVTAFDGTCNNIKTINVAVNDAPSQITLASSSATPNCSGSTVTLNATGGTIPSLVTILNEKFEVSGLPTGWDTLNSNPQTATTIAGKWTQRNNNYSTSDGTSFRSNDSSKFYLANSRPVIASPPAYVTSLRSPRLDFTSYDSVSLSFYQYYASFFNDSITVEYWRSSTGASTALNSTTYNNGINGVGWTKIYSKRTSIGGNQAFQKTTINLTPFLDLLRTRDTMYLRFRYAAKGDFYWAIDNVKIEGRGGSPITWSPISGLFDNSSCTVPYSGAVFNPTVYTNPTGPVTYTAIAGTPNGCSVSKSVTLNPRAAVTSSISGSTTVCPGSNATFPIVLTGKAPWNISIKNITANTTQTVTTSLNPYPYTTPTAINATTVFKVTALKDSFITSTNFGCAASATALAADSFKINVGAIAARLSGNTAICSGQSTNLIFNLTGSQPWRVRYLANGTPVVATGVNTNPYVVSVTPSVTTTYTLDSLKDNSGCAAIRDSLFSNATIVVNPSSSAAISGTQTICTGSSANLSVNLSGTAPWNLTYTNGSTPVTVTGIVSSPYNLTVSPTVNTTYTLTSLSDGGGCAAAAAALTGSGSVTVTPLSLGGSVSGGASVCAGSNNTILTLSGHTGNVLRWESSLDSFATAGTPVTNATTSLTATNLSVTTYYRAVVANGSCAAVNSSIGVIRISPNSAGGNVTGGTIVCSGTNNTTLTLNGHVGNVVRWESSANNFATAGTTIANTTASLTVTNVSTTTYYRAVVASGSCPSANSSSASLVVGPVVTGSLSGTASICENGSTNLTVALTGIRPWRIVYNANGANPVTINNITTTPYSFSVSPAATTTYQLVSVTDSLGCSALASAMSSNAVVSITVSSTTTWTGNSSNWFDGNNWCGGVPTSTKDVLIPSGISNMPVISGGNASARGITINSGAILTITTNGTISVSGNTTNNGTLINNGVFTLNGTTDQSFPGGATGVVDKMNALVVNKLSGAVTFDKKFPITDSGVLKITRAGTININDTITIRSGITGTARIDSIPPATLFVYNGTGCFTVERFIPTGLTHGKSWQLLSVPTKGQTIRQAWQEGAGVYTSNPVPGYGTTITSNLTGATTSLGFDFYTPSGPTMKVYDPVSNTYIGVPNTNATPITNPKGYMFFVRGDRSILTSAAAALPVKLRTNGKIFYGTGPDSALSLAVPAGKFQSAGNPYASPIDFQKVLLSSNGLNPSFYVWDPTLQSGTGLGAFQTISSFNNWQPVPGGTTNYNANVPSSVIPSGQAFFVYSASGGTVKFAESNKASNTATAFRNPGNTDLSVLNLFLKDGNGVVQDGNLLAVDSSSSDNADANDALKLVNFGENIGISNGGRFLAIDARNAIDADDTVYYHISNFRQQAYRLVFAPKHFDRMNLTAMLVDRYTRTEYLVSLSDTTLIDINATNDNASRQSDRFFLIFKSLRPVPLTFTNIRATDEKARVAVTWDVAGESNISAYEVEKSADGSHFAYIGSVLPRGNDGRAYSYTHHDNQPFDGLNYYRVRSIDFSGAIRYTDIVSVKRGAAMPHFVVSPNPATQQNINLIFISQPAGTYKAEIYNQLGQHLHTQTIGHNGLSRASYKCQTERKLPAGVYTIRILTPTGIICPEKVTILSE